MNLLSKIKSNSFALWVAILSVLVQSFHSYTAFYDTSSLKGTGWGIAQAVLFAIVIDLAILFYTVRNKTKVALGAAFVMVVINSYYYYQHLGISFQFIFGVFLSLTIPTSVYFYSEEIKEDPADVDYESDEERELREANNNLQHQADQYRQTIRSLEATIKAGKEENKNLGERIDEERLNNKKLRDEKNVAQEWLKTREGHLEQAHKEFKTLEQNYEEAIRLRDLAIQSESMARQAMQKMADHAGRVDDPTPADKSLVNVQDERPAKIISATLQGDELPESDLFT